MRKAAIFDIDGTVFRGSLLIELVESFIAEGVFPKSSRKIYERQLEKWQNRAGSYEDYIEAVVQTFMAHLRGVPYRDFERVGKRVVEKNKNRVYRYTRDLAKKLKRRGYYLLAISQSPKGLLDDFCKNFGFNKIYGRFYELGPSDKFTGEVTDLHLIANKANIVRRVVEKEKLSLKDSYGIGDTEGDIPVLELVAHPVCFNPNAALYRFAKLNGWSVVVERKDVVYKIQ